MVFSPALASGLLLEWQQSFSALQDSPEYSGPSQQCYGRDSHNFVSYFNSSSSLSKPLDLFQVHQEPQVPQLRSFSWNLQVLVYPFVWQNSPFFFLTAIGATQEYCQAVLTNPEESRSTKDHFYSHLPPITQNNSSKTNNTCKALIEKQEPTHKQYSLMDIDVSVLADHQRLTSALYRHRMPPKRPTNG